MQTDEYLRERDRIMGILKARRKELRLTQIRLAHLAGMSGGTAVWAWENGQCDPRLHSLVHLAYALRLRITFEDILEDR